MHGLASPKGTTADGRPVWDRDRFGFVEGEAPETVNPSLWRQERLNGIAGRFEVVDGIYQVRGLDLSKTSFVRGETGWIVLDDFPFWFDIVTP